MSLFWVFIGVVFLGVFLARWFFSADAVARRKMKALPVCPIEDVPEGGRVRIVGRVELGEAVQSPLSRRPCAVWRVVVEERRSNGDNSYWRKVIDRHDAGEFFVCQGDARARVEAGNVQPVLEQDARYSSGMFDNPTPELEAFLDECGVSSRGFFFNKRMRYREGVVAAGEMVAVVGVGSWEADPDQGLRAQGYREAQAERRLVMRSPSDGPLLVSDEVDVTE